MKNKFYFRYGFNGDFYFQKPTMINFEFLSFHWEDHSRWITVLGFSFIWELVVFETVRKK